MFPRVWPQPWPFGSEHQRDTSGSERLLQFGLGVASQTDPPETGVADLLERPGEVHDARPRHALERTRCRLGDDSALGRRMPILCYNADCAKGGGGPQDGTHIVRVRDLVEDQQDGFLRSSGQQVVEPMVIQRLDFDHHPLMRRIVRHQPAKVGDVCERHGDILGKLHKARRFTRRPGAKHLALRIVERRCDGVLAPQAWPVRGPVTLMRYLAPRHADFPWRRGVVRATEDQAQGVGPPRSRR